MENQVVSFNYVLRDDSGEVLDSSGENNQITYLEGTGMIIDGLESALRTLSKGDKKKISLAPEEAYGAYDEARIQTIDRSALPVEELEVGAMFQAGDDRHAPVVRVIAIEDDKVKLDANHPLAGRSLHFDVEVLDRRDPTEDEVAHGHAHGPGGHQH